MEEGEEEIKEISLKFEGEFIFRFLGVIMDNINK